MGSIGSSLQTPNLQLFRIDGGFVPGLTKALGVNIVYYQSLQGSMFSLLIFAFCMEPFDSSLLTNALC